MKNNKCPECGKPKTRTGSRYSKRPIFTVCNCDTTPSSAEEFVNDLFGEGNYTHSPFQIYRSELIEWLEQYTNRETGETEYHTTQYAKGYSDGFQDCENTMICPLTEEEAKSLFGYESGTVRHIYASGHKIVKA